MFKKNSISFETIKSPLVKFISKKIKNVLECKKCKDKKIEPILKDEWINKEKIGHDFIKDVIEWISSNPNKFEKIKHEDSFYGSLEIIGEWGIGKSLYSLLIAKKLLQKNILTFYINGEIFNRYYNTSYKFIESVVESITHDIDFSLLKYSEKEIKEIKDNIYKFIKESFNNDERIVFIIDDLHKVSLEKIDKLSNFIRTLSLDRYKNIRFIFVSRVNHNINPYGFKVFLERFDYYKVREFIKRNIDKLDYKERERFLNGYLTLKYILRADNTWIEKPAILKELLSHKYLLDLILDGEYERVYETIIKDKKFIGLNSKDYIEIIDSLLDIIEIGSDRYILINEPSPYHDIDPSYSYINKCELYKKLSKLTGFTKYRDIETFLKTYLPIRRIFINNKSNKEESKVIFTDEILDVIPYLFVSKIKDYLIRKEKAQKYSLGEPPNDKEFDEIIWKYLPKFNKYIFEATLYLLREENTNLETTILEKFIEELSQRINDYIKKDFVLTPEKLKTLEQPIKVFIYIQEYLKNSEKGKELLNRIEKDLYRMRKFSQNYKISWLTSQRIGEYCVIYYPSNLLEIEMLEYRVPVENKSRFLVFDKRIKKYIEMVYEYESIIPYTIIPDLRIEYLGKNRYYDSVFLLAPEEFIKDYKKEMGILEKEQ